DPVPARDGKDPPLTPGYVPPVMVAEPVPEPVSNAGGIFSVPVIVPAPPVSVMVKGALKFPVESGVRETDPLNVPLPIFVSVAVPVAEMPLRPMLPDAFTVNVVLIVAAGAAAPTSSAKAKVENVRFIGLLESSTLRTRKFGEIWLIWHHTVPL